MVPYPGFLTFFFPPFEFHGGDQDFVSVANKFSLPLSLNEAKEHSYPNDTSPPKVKSALREVYDEIALELGWEEDHAVFGWEK